MRHNLIEKLHQAVENVRSSSSAQARPTQGQADPAGTTPTPKKRNPFNDILQGIGR
jgi:hypothetical protein